MEDSKEKNFLYILLFFLICSFCVVNFNAGGYLGKSVWVCAA